ncbi:MAG: hypothetical protein A2418_01115 [Candidatus Brennerbacteria bacterium RIFOXYC1_FULL_41_11]|uniref:DNA replication/recombination mediator RecO N-terminal domain-containing protein n=1 Tax=Candidatus Brennerbacteria bacterium RIFOXYD1_FULL_41_16 TaxID=1797529 RepID=A0A1G1XLG5_9BACT|nr:MAG: repair protein RecO protein [Parcubacteria group bacterium GW2011_GWB1_41_4]OGY39409.1 MAG: hypothetical protein A2391_02985 [Candidatus Brennerbacteria bacterium RIFOXYB1_FULL_41_13]OGY40043.1 MAG: hypothetical protein A2418_01115 [Candidatus Brennerbacteria bacterium RIFOXYC1_FULL_41_11]OGY40975.1 MAG: hypothetical protein A2570_00585 [Candidatus Brennerbacteria bacterium RIFOXYD1_FULL_41_16]
MSFTNAFVLSYKNINEFDRRYSLLTRDFGKIEAVVKSILKSNSKLAGHLEPPSLCWVELIERGNSFQLTQALEQKNFSKLKKNQGALSLVLKLSDFINGFVGKDTDDEFFSIWDSFLDYLESHLIPGEILDFEFLEVQTELRFLKQLGFLPEVSDRDLDARFFDEYKIILGGNILAKSVFSEEIKKIALRFKDQAASYMA